MSRLLDDTKCYEPTFLKEYFIYQIFSDQNNTAAPLRAIYRVAVILCEDTEEQGDDNVRNCVELLCSLTIEEGRQHQHGDWARVTEDDKNFDYHLLVAAAYLGHLRLLKILLPKVDFRLDGSPLFGHPAPAAAIQGNDEALELILSSEWKRTGLRALCAAIAHGRFRTVDLLLEPRWRLEHAPDNGFTVAIWQGLKVTNSVAMFSRAFPLLGDYEADPRTKRLGLFLRYSAEHGHTMLALHLFHIGAMPSGHQSETFEDYNPLWCACKHGNETLVRLLLRKGADPNIVIDTPLSTPLQVATRRGHLGIVRALLDYGADIHRASKDGPPPVVSAIELEHIRILRLLCQRGAVFDGRRSRIAFERVAKSGLESMAKILLQEGAVPTEQSVIQARAYGNHTVSRILCEALHDTKDDSYQLLDVDWIK